MAASRLFARFGPTIVPPIDRAVHRLSGGRLLLSRGMLPCAIVTTTGRRTGERRETPLAAVPLDGDLYVVGSNFGKPSHPAWSWNLLADPLATVSFEGDEYLADAQLLDAEDKRSTWPRLTEQWPLFDQYVDRSGRDLRVFRLRRREP
jgi:deazaflavin-dependent oxidoreductase (nitroreductase family)